MRPVASSRVRGAGGGSRAIVTNSSLRCESVLPSKRRARREDSRPTSFRRGRNPVHQEMTPGGLADLLGAEGVRNPEGGLVPGDRQESGEEAVAVDPLEDPFLDHLVRVAAGGRKRLEEGLREVRRADVERVARWPGVIGRPRPRGAAENGERLGGAEQAC